MTNKEAIEILCDQIKGNKSEAMQMALNALCEPNWIPCSERLPEKSDDVVLVTVIDERRARDIYLMRCDQIKSAYIKKWISAWMPLPEPYKGGKE